MIDNGGLWERLLAATAPDCPPDGGTQASDEYGDYGGDGYSGGEVYKEGDTLGQNGGHHRGLLDVLYSRLLAATGGDPCGGKGGYSQLDYTVLSVAMWTLALVLVVEVGRHYIDKKAHNRAFFRTVLEGMYRELTTLGIVEFALFLFQTYMQDFDEKIYKLFSKVHFLLFFTAIINALMSVILAVIASRISRRMWVQTEELELNHYIAIREEFDRIDAALKYMSEEQSASHQLDRTNRSLAEPVFAFSRPGLRRSLHNIKQRVRYPLLKRKHDRLLVQVRFHELRVHFLKANNLPLKFRVSEYLMKSEIHVFKKLVHISTFAWITVASFVNLLYFLMGITAYVTSDEEVVSLAMGCIYLGLMIVFVPMAWIIERKMKWIFRQIMQMKLIDLTAPDDEGDDEDSASDGSYDQGEHDINKQVERSLSKRGLVQGNKIHQLDLFWGGDPHYIIGAFQFMQLGYAIAASILLIFWNYLQWRVFEGFFVIILVVCYFLFVITMAQVVPRYTLCTSLGQLVNRRRLHETMAQFKLEEAKRKRRHKQEEVKIASRLRESLHARLEPRQEQGKFRESALSVDGSLSVEEQFKAKAEMAQKKETDIMTDTLGIPAEKNDGNASSTGKRSESEKGSEDTRKMEKLAELVQTRTQDLPQHLPPPKSAAQIRSERRRNRMRSMSDGVQLMRQLGGSVASLSLTPSSSISDAAATELSSFAEGEGNDPFSHRKSSRTPVPASGPTEADDGKGTAVAVGRRRSRERRRLQKSQSENVAMMRSPASSFFGPGSVMPPSEEKEEEKDGTSMFKPYSGFASRPMHKSSSATRMSALMEDIPSRSVDATIISVPVGRKGTDFENKPVLTVGDGSRLSTVFSNESEEIDKSKELEEGGTAGPDQQTEKGDTAGTEPKVFSSTASGDEDDSDTVNTDDSESGHSDFDDLPEIAPSEIEKRNEPEEPLLTWDSRLETFFLSSRYRFMSGVFGTMIVFFIIGMRVEIMLVEGPNEIMPDNESTWHLTPKSSFYIEVSWLSLFLVVSLLSSIVFFPKSCGSDLAENRTNVKMTIAIASDIFLSALCLFLLLWAEKSRSACCETQDGKGICYEFGSRLCGGLGSIEPWTSLVALRVLRFEWGRLVTNLLLRWKGHIQSRRKRSRFTESIYISRHAERAGESRHGDSIRSTTSAHAAYMQETHLPKSLLNETGTIVELWKIGISIYPDIAEKYGEFSGELLQAMLGIEISGGPRSRGTVARATSPISKGTLIESREPPESAPVDEGALGVALTASLTLNESKYSKLDPNAQGIILAGQIGKSVRCLGDTAKAGTESVIHPSAVEVLPSPYKSQNDVRFELDKEMDDDEFLNIIINPNARLIRSMRRCERRLPPMLDKWAVVDVVLTNEELVYFDARDVDGLCDNLAKMDPEALSKMNTVKEALFATKGGKGLRLRDVAVGRKVVGHLELEDIDMAKVECLSPFDEAGWYVSGDDVEEEEPSSHVSEEYWKAPDTHLIDAPCQSRNQRWKQVTEHRLKLHSLQGPLYLRFYSDLEDAENHSSDDDASENHVHKNDALHWCQTVARLCGSEQLNQDLVHLGEEGSAELRDFMETIDRGNGGNKGKKQQMLSKVMTTVNLHKRSATISRAGSISERLSAMGSGNKHNMNTDMNGENGPRRQSVVRFQGIDTGKDGGFEDEESSPGLPV